jgi:hypothetical protein
MGKMTCRDQYDLVYCLNVLDQCSNPIEIIQSAMTCTKLDGVLALSCSYQWSKKHLQDLREVVTDIKSYFDDSWELLEEIDLDDKFRFNERYSKLFSCHVVLFKKI